MTWLQLRAYLMLHSSFQSLIRNHFGMTKGRSYAGFIVSLPWTDLRLMGPLFNISNFSDVFDEEHFINSLSNDVKVEKKLPKELLKAPKSVRYFKSWSGVDYYEDEISPLWDHRQVWIQPPLRTSILANSKQWLLMLFLELWYWLKICTRSFELLSRIPVLQTTTFLLIFRSFAVGPFSKHWDFLPQLKL